MNNVRRLGAVAWQPPFKSFLNVIASLPGKHWSHKFGLDWSLSSPVNLSVLFIQHYLPFKFCWGGLLRLWLLILNTVRLPNDYLYFSVLYCLYLYLCCPHAHLELRLETCEESQKLSGSYGSKYFQYHQYRHKEADVSKSAPHKYYSWFLFLILPLAVNQTPILLFKKTWNLCWHTVNSCYLLRHSLEKGNH